MSLQAVIEAAKADLGYTESPPNSNKTKFGEWYGMNGQPWCVMALAYWFNRAGERMAFFGGGKTASCETLLRWYMEQGLMYSASEVQVGDIVILNFHGTQDTEHCGLVVGVNYHQTGGWKTSVQTIEGNTTPGEEGSQDNGGCVALKTRWGNQVVGVCRPQYKPEEPQPVDDITGHWAKASIEWAKEKGLIKGYPDGSFQPDKPLTRAEMCAILERFYALLWEDDLR